MNIIVAPNAFKGSLTAEQAAEAIASGLYKSTLTCDIIVFPVADGGNDTVELLIKQLGAQTITVQVHDPLKRMITANFGWLPGERRAIIGIAEASGLQLLKENELDPLHANTFGTGELIKSAFHLGAKEIVIGLGGSATVDGGTGLLSALGLRLSNKDNMELTLLPKQLRELQRVDLSKLDRHFSTTAFMGLCDVQNRLLGDKGAVKVFAPQKGAGENEIELLEQCLQRWNDVTFEATGKDMSSVRCGGAAGGVGVALFAYANANLVSGIDYFLQVTRFSRILKEADIVITGEGKIDSQTLSGKGPFGIALAAKERQLPVIAFAGKVVLPASTETSPYFNKLIQINPADMPLDEALKHTYINLESAAYSLGNELAKSSGV